MQTTLTIDDDLLKVAEKLAAARSVPVDTVISELIRKGLESAEALEQLSGFPVFKRRAGAPIITTEDVRRAEDEP